MLVRRLAECETFLAGDKTLLREILHPDKADLSLRYSLAHAVVKPGEESLRHRLSVSEVYYILEGAGVMMVAAEAREVSAGDTVYIQPHATQCIRNTGERDLKFLCIVDPAWRLEYEEVDDP